MSDSALSEDELESELDNSLYSLLYLFIETLTGTRDGKRPQFQQILHGAHLNIAHRVDLLSGRKWQYLSVQTAKSREMGYVYIGSDFSRYNKYI